MAQPPNEELSALAQEFLQAHRDHQSPQAPQEDRVWQRLHHSAFVAPALLVEPLSQATSAGQGTSAAGGGHAAAAAGKGGVAGATGAQTVAAAKGATGVQVAAAAKGGLSGAVGVQAAAGIGKAGVAAGLAKGGILGSLGAKIVLGLGVTAGLGLGAVAWQQNASDAPAQEPQVQRQIPKIQGDGPSSSTVPDLSIHAAPQDAAASALKLTPELSAQLAALSAIDEAIRKRRFASARTRISHFYTSYAQSPFALDLSALEMILACRSKQKPSEPKLRRLLADPRARRYWARIKKSCSR